MSERTTAEEARGYPKYWGSTGYRLFCTVCHTEVAKHISAGCVYVSPCPVCRRKENGKICMEKYDHDHDLKKTTLYPVTVETVSKLLKEIDKLNVDLANLRTKPKPKKKGTK